MPQMGATSPTKTTVDLAGRARFEDGWRNAPLRAAICPYSDEQVTLKARRLGAIGRRGGGAGAVKLDVARAPQLSRYGSIRPWSTPAPARLLQSHRFQRLEGQSAVESACTEAAQPNADPRTFATARDQLQRAVATVFIQGFPGQ
jgi:hypothetical protein